MIMFKLPQLPYTYQSLEPHIDAMTMEIHHSKHHQWYVNNLNAAVEWTDFEWKSLHSLLSKPDQLPKNIRQTVVNNWWWHYNHSLFWENMAPNSWWEPTWPLWEAINNEFGSFVEFQQAFTKKATSLFWSWWVYLCKDKSWSLRIKRCSFQETPLKIWLIPLLWLDLREHAYYLQYQNRRTDYIIAWWNVINRNKVWERYDI